MTHEEKIDAALGVIDTVLAQARNPAVLVSFGKDSMCLLHLVLRRKKLPVFFHREPFQHHKYEFANQVIRDWDLTVRDYPPLTTSIKQRGSDIEIINHYQIGARYMYLPTGIEDAEDKANPLCALHEIYDKPTGTYAYRHDFVFHGHRSADVDPMLGAVPLNSDIAFNVDSASAAFPLRHWTDEDVWKYTEDHGVPIHHARYEKVDGKWRERADRRFNPDYIQACARCFDRNAGASVHCPKLNLTVSNVAHQLRQAETPQLEYLKQ